jgi:type 1 fimbriae regulatory protein FimB
MKHTTEHKAANHANETKHLNESELVDVLELAMKTSARDHALLLVCYVHALRAAEVAGIRMGDISQQNQELTVQRLKGGLKTTQPIVRHRGRPCLDEHRALKTWMSVRKADGSDFLFLSQKGGALGHDAVNRIFKAYCQRASELRLARGEAPISTDCWHIHVLRHSRLTHLAGRVDLFLLKLVAGHRAVSSTILYMAGSQKLAAAEAQRVSMEIFA